MVNKNNCDERVLELVEVIRRSPICKSHSPATSEDFRDYLGPKLPLVIRRLCQAFGYLVIDGSKTILGMSPSTTEDPEKSIESQFFFPAMQSKGLAGYPTEVLPVMRHGKNTFYAIRCDGPHKHKHPVIIWDYYHKEGIIQHLTAKPVADDFIDWLSDLIDPDGSLRKKLAAEPSAKKSRGKAGGAKLLKSTSKVAEPTAPPFEDELPATATMDRVLRSLRGRAAKSTDNPEPAVTLGEGTPADQIAAAEKKLGITLPESYKQFVREVTSAEFDGTVVMGIGTAKQLASDAVDHDAVRCIVMHRREGFLKGLPHLFPIYNCGNGDLHCLDTSKLKNGECPVVYWSHELVEEDNGDRLAPNFRRWLIEQYNEANFG